MNNGKLKMLSEQELSEINGGVFFIPPLVVLGGAFTSGFGFGVAVGLNKVKK
ncbi:class IIb bacteriocin, lactobin A/cerein 7B family [Leuconostoc miyukkimchii]|uniref:class IIb bacteriocin, lactobin A/cerein 7B family n=1 Tax=Leuconostoc miyukkimchii TaxID=910540 RepID=UPI001C7D42C6|nr:class IIb bacteriocin, lactobin A/cerein 7B family [Leuconostoc miyukkimchii]